MGISSGLGAIIAGVVAAGAGAGTSIYASNVASDNAKAALKEQQDSQNALYAEQKQATDNATSQAAMTQQRDQAAQNESISLANAQGANSTVLTSPLNAPTNSTLGKATLLGV